MDAKELLARYAAGERNFIGVDLSQADLRAEDLSGANLSNATLIEIYSSCVNLFGAKLSNANLRAADLIGANLFDAKLDGANLRGANLNFANLCVADLRGADLSNASLSAANLIGTDLTDSDLSGAMLDGTILSYRELIGELQLEKQQLAEQIQLLQAQLEKQKLTEDSRQASNQGINAPHEWKGFYFRSKTEIKIAEAFDRTGILFYPNCKARLSTSVGREGRETDFLVFYQGKWGILEVDGESWHPPSRTVHDHERDRLFKVHGIRVVEHYDATRCFQHPDEVVREFLEILRQA